MISRELYDQTHHFVILDLAVQTVQADLHRFSMMRLSFLLTPMLEKVLKTLLDVYYPMKRSLRKQQIEIVRWTSVDGYFSDVTLRTAGEDLTMRYAKRVLKQEVERLIEGAWKNTI